jgi:organic radical activating enzyme
MTKVDLNDYVCGVPFAALEIHEKDRFLCCASWLKKHLPQHTSPKDAWESFEANEIRESVIDGSFRHCDKTQCPYLHQLENFGEIGNTSTLYHKNKLPKELKSKIESFRNGILSPPSTIQFSFDRTCNLKCPSCRINLIVENSKGIERVKKTIDEIENQYGQTTKRLYITGTGDPFLSVGFRDFLRNFDSNKWPSLSHIHLHTNATRWDKKMWESMTKVHKYVKTCEISIDAAIKDTYENKVRVGGNWDELIENLKFTHLGGQSHNKIYNFEANLSRNWHYNWSKFYYIKKNFGYLFAIKKSFSILFKILLKLFKCKIKNNKNDFLLAKAELLGLLSSILLKKSSYRPYKKNEL